MMTPTTRPRPPFRGRYEQQKESCDPRDVGSSWSTEILFFGGLFVAYAVYRGMYPEAFVRAAIASWHPPGSGLQYRDPDRVELTHGARGPTPRSWADEEGSSWGLILTHRCSAASSSASRVIRVQGEVRPPPDCRALSLQHAPLRVATRDRCKSPQTEIFFSPLLRDDRDARAAHDRSRACRCGWSSRLMSARRSRRLDTPRTTVFDRDRSASTGTSSTSSGSSSSRCST